MGLFSKTTSSSPSTTSRTRTNHAYQQQHHQGLIPSLSNNCSYSSSNGSSSGGIDGGTTGTNYGQQHQQQQQQQNSNRKRYPNHLLVTSRFRRLQEEEEQNVKEEMTNAHPVTTTISLSEQKQGLQQQQDNPFFLLQQQQQEQQQRGVGGMTTQANDDDEYIPPSSSLLLLSSFAGKKKGMVQNNKSSSTTNEIIIHHNSGSSNGPAFGQNTMTVASVSDSSSSSNRRNVSPHRGTIIQQQQQQQELLGSPKVPLSRTRKLLGDHSPMLLRNPRFLLQQHGNNKKNKKNENNKNHKNTTAKHQQQQQQQQMETKSLLRFQRLDTMDSDNEDDNNNNNKDDDDEDKNHIFDEKFGDKTASPLVNGSSSSSSSSSNNNNNRYMEPSTITLTPMRNLHYQKRQHHDHPQNNHHYQEASSGRIAGNSNTISTMNNNQSNNNNSHNHKMLKMCQSEPRFRHRRPQKVGMKNDFEPLTTTTTTTKEEDDHKIRMLMPLTRLYDSDESNVMATIMGNDTNNDNDNDFLLPPRDNNERNDQDNNNNSNNNNFQFESQDNNNNEIKNYNNISNNQSKRTNPTVGRNPPLLLSTISSTLSPHKQQQQQTKKNHQYNKSPMMMSTTITSGGGGFQKLRSPEKDTKSVSKNLLSLKSLGSSSSSASSSINSLSNHSSQKKQHEEEKDNNSTNSTKKKNHNPNNFFLNEKQLKEHDTTNKNRNDTIHTHHHSGHMDDDKEEEEDTDDIFDVRTEIDEFHFYQPPSSSTSSLVPSYMGGNNNNNNGTIVDPAVVGNKGGQEESKDDGRTETTTTTTTTTTGNNSNNLWSIPYSNYDTNHEPKPQQQMRFTTTNINTTNMPKKEIESITNGVNNNDDDDTTTNFTNDIYYDEDDESGIFRQIVFDESLQQMKVSKVKSDHGASSSLTTSTFLLLPHHNNNTTNKFLQHKNNNNNNNNTGKDHDDSDFVNAAAQLTQKYSRELLDIQKIRQEKQQQQQEKQQLHAPLPQLQKQYNSSKNNAATNISSLTLPVANSSATTTVSASNTIDSKKTKSVTLYSSDPWEPLTGNDPLSTIQDLTISTPMRGKLSRRPIRRNVTTSTTTEKNEGDSNDEDDEEEIENNNATIPTTPIPVTTPSLVAAKLLAFSQQSVPAKYKYSPGKMKQSQQHQPQQQLLTTTNTVIMNEDGNSSAKTDVKTLSLEVQSKNISHSNSGEGKEINNLITQTKESNRSISLVEEAMKRKGQPCFDNDSDNDDIENVDPFSEHYDNFNHVEPFERDTNTATFHRSESSMKMSNENVDPFKTEVGGDSFSFALDGDDWKFSEFNPFQKQNVDTVSTNSKDTRNALVDNSNNSLHDTDEPRVNNILIETMRKANLENQQSHGNQESTLSTIATSDSSKIGSETYLKRDKSNPYPYAQNQNKMFISSIDKRENNNGALSSTQRQMDASSHRIPTNHENNIDNQHADVTQVNSNANEIHSVEIDTHDSTTIDNVRHRNMQSYAKQTVNRFMEQKGLNQKMIGSKGNETLEHDTETIDSDNVTTSTMVQSEEKSSSNQKKPIGPQRTAPKAVPTNAILGSMLFRQTLAVSDLQPPKTKWDNNKNNQHNHLIKNRVATYSVASKDSVHKAKMSYLNQCTKKYTDAADACVHEDAEEDDDDDESKYQYVKIPRNVHAKMDGAESAVSSVTEEASTFYQKTFRPTQQHYHRQPNHYHHPYGGNNTNRNKSTSHAAWSQQAQNIVNSYNVTKKPNNKNSSSHIADYGTKRVQTKVESQHVSHSEDENGHMFSF